MPSSADGATRARLLSEIPEVFLGADASAAWSGRPGLLHGGKRHGQVDVFHFARWTGEAGSGLRDLIAERFRHGAEGGWPVVGVAVPPKDFAAGSEALLEGLVAGDVVMTACEGGLLFVHRGDRLVPAVVV